MDDLNDKVDILGEGIEEERDLRWQGSKVGQGRTRLYQVTAKQEGMTLQGRSVQFLGIWHLRRGFVIGCV